MIGDLRQALRGLRRTRGLTTVMVAVLAIGVGMTTTLFAVVDGVLLRPLPYRDPGRLVTVATSDARGQRALDGLSAAELVALPSVARTLEQVGGHRPWGFVLGGTGEPERVLGARVSAALFPMLGARVLVGRVPTLEEDAFGRGRVVVLGEALWRRRFAADRGIVGRAVVLNDEPCTVVGVVDGRSMLPDAELWTPLALAPYELAQRGDRPLAVVARLRAGTTLAAARRDVQGAMQALVREAPDAGVETTAQVTPLHETVVGTVRVPLLLLFGATVVVLLVACGNLALLLLARAAARDREVALRAALGASRGRVLRLFAIESLLVVVAGSVLGIVLATLATGALAQAGPALVPRLRELHVDGRVVAFACLTMSAAAALLALVPMRSARAASLHALLRTSATRSRAVGGVTVRDLLVVGQLAMALALLAGGGVLARSFWRISHVDPGFVPQGVLTATLSLPGSRYPTPASRAALVTDVRRRVATRPGVRDAGFVSHLPLAAGASGRRTPPLTADVVADGRAGAARAHFTTITPGYLEAMRVRLVRGRTFTDADDASARPVVVVDEALARRIAPDGDAVGHRVRVGATVGADTSWREVVGVVAGVRRESVLEAPQPTVYVPHAQNPWPTVSLVVRADGDPTGWAGAVRAQLHALDPELPLYNLQPLTAVVARAMALQRLQALVVGALAATVLLLAVLGVHGVLAWLVAGRTRELGIRLALGASRGAVRRLVLRQLFARLAVGGAVGGLLALASGGVLRSVLYEVSPLDPATLLGAAAVLGVAALVASWMPVRRAVRVDPMLAIRDG